MSEHPAVHCKQRRLRILTVGDGDLSLSLAILRCYQNYVTVTATTIVATADKLVATYPQTAALNLRELALVDKHAEILYGVDACQLHTRFLSSNEHFDLVLFQYPHLGDDDSLNADEMELVQRHCSLLAHYLESARHISKVVHVTLGSNQAESWRLFEAAETVGLALCGSRIPVQHPFHHIFPDIDDTSFPWNDNPDWQPDPSSKQQQQRQRTSKRHGGSRHWLGRYGYKHVRTTTIRDKAPPNLTDSHHYVFCHTDGTTPVFANPETTASTTCSICGISFGDAQVLKAHLKAPAVPLMSCPGTNNVVMSTNSIVELTTVQNQTDETVTPAATGPSDGTANETTACDDDDPELFVLTVSSNYEGKRLRWYLQHCCENKIPQYSKRKWERIIQNGAVRVNGDTATDSGRILQSGWKVTLTAVDSDRRNRTPLALPIVIMDTCWDATSKSVDGNGAVFVVWKPVGMRTIGSFDASTLEETFSRQQQQENGAEIKYKSLSKLDTGCSGLCVLQADRNDQQRPTKVTHTFSALVHGLVPVEWQADGISVQLPIDGLRRWKKRASSDTNDDEALNSNHPCVAQLTSVEQTTGTISDSFSALNTTKGKTIVPELSTVTITTDSDASGLAQTIAYYLRKTEHAVVGDRFAMSEYMSLLPRPMRNRIKQRLCMGCTGVEIIQGHQHHETVQPIPDKWRASYWQEFCSHSAPPSTAPSGDEYSSR